MKKLAMAALVLAAVLAGPVLAQCGGCPSKGSSGCETADKSYSPTGASSGLAKLKLVDLEGDTMAFSAYIGARPTVLLVAGTDSASRVAAGVLEQARVEAGKTGPTFLAAIAAPKQQSAALRKSLKLGFPVLPDPDKNVAGALAARDLPLVVFYDKTGRPVKAARQFEKERIMQGIRAAQAMSTAVDPVCGMTVTPERAAAKYQYKGKTYYFCNASCKTSFEKNPDKYLSE